jgi:hypothetical protein
LWMDGVFCVNPGVGVSMYICRSHNNLAKLNGSQESICRMF